MKNRVSWMTILSVAAISLGAGVYHELWAVQFGPNNRCGGGGADITCPDTTICQFGGHCMIQQYHKCINPAWNDDFPVCAPWPNWPNCQRSATGCEFEEWTLFCGAPLGVILKPQCYGECL